MTPEHETHGQLEAKPTYQTLSQLWGDDGGSKYGFTKLDEYSTWLNELNGTDLHAHATRVGLVPIDDRGRLIRTLEREFEEHMRRYQVLPAQTTSQPSNINKEIAKILQEGR